MSSPSSTSVHAIAASRKTSAPGRMNTCWSASSAVSVRRGSITTILPPRGGLQRLRLAAEVGHGPQAAVRHHRVRADDHEQVCAAVMSGTGIVSQVAEHQAGGELLRHLVQRRRGVHVLRVPSGAGPTRVPYSKSPSLCAVGLPIVIATASRGFTARIGGNRRSISAKASSQLTSTCRPSRLTSGARRRSASSWRSRSAAPFGQMKPSLNGGPPCRRGSPRRGAVVHLELEAAARLAERAGPVVRRHGEMLTRLCAARSKARCDAHSIRPAESYSAAAASRLRPSRASGQDRIECCSPVRTEQPSRAVMRASTIGGPAPKLATGALVGQSSAAQTYSGRTEPSSAASDSSGRPARAEQPVVAGKLEREDAQAVAGRAIRTAHEAGGKGVLGGPVLVPARLGALELLRRQRPPARRAAAQPGGPRRQAARRRGALHARRRRQPRAGARAAAACAASPRSPPRSPAAPRSPQV